MKDEEILKALLYGNHLSEEDITRGKAIIHNFNNRLNDKPKPKEQKEILIIDTHFIGLNEMGLTIKWFDKVYSGILKEN